MEETKKKIAETIFQKPTLITVPVIKPTLFEKLHGIKERKFEIAPAPLATMIKISNILLNVTVDKDFNVDIMNSGLKIVSANGEDMARIIALAVTSSRIEPPASLVRFFVNNLTSKKLNELLAIVVEKLDLVNFIISIISIKKASLLEMNPKEQRS